MVGFESEEEEEEWLDFEEEEWLDFGEEEWLDFGQDASGQRSAI